MKNCLKNTRTSRPEPRVSSEVVQNRERIDDLRILPPKFAKLSKSQQRVLGHLYGQWRAGKPASVHQLGTTYDTLEAMHRLRLLNLKGDARSWAYLTYFGVRTYEVIYWHERALLEDRHAKRRASVFGKRGKE